MFSTFRPGEVIAGKYSVEGMLGRGGMGLVLAARHVQLDERVAIKLLLPEVAASAEAVARFVREARAAAKIKSEHVVRVTDVGTLEQGGVPYMVMEYLVGSDLAALLASRGRLPIEEVAEYVLQACEAISEAHALGIVHRDLKPSNLYLTRRVDGTPVVKVLDFGISKVTADPGEQWPGVISQTQTGALMGTPLYMSPEQMTSARDVDARSDIWALGVIIYELLSGTRPFSGTTLPEVCALILESNMPLLRDKVPGLPEGVESLVARCIVRDRGARFSDVGELSRALVTFAPRRARVSVDRISAALGSGATYARAPSSDDPLAAPTTQRGTAAAWVESKATTGQPVWRTLVAGLGLAALAAGVGVFGFGRRSPTDPAASATPASARHQATAPAIEPAAVVQPPSVTPVALAPSASPDASAAPANLIALAPSRPSASLPSPTSAAAPPRAPRKAALQVAPKSAVAGVRPTAVPKESVPKEVPAAAAKPKAPLTLGGRL